MSYTHFTLDERKYLQELLAEGYSLRKISEFLGRNVSSVSREIKRNKTAYPKKKSNNKYKYNSWAAQCRAICRRRKNAKNAIKPDSNAWNYVVEKLKMYWSPEQISNRWHKDYPDEPTISVSTIYRYIRKKYFGEISVKGNLRRRGKKLMPKKSNYNTIHPERIIPDWPEYIKKRVRKGDWEGDTIYGGIGKGFLITLVDRKTRYLAAGIVYTRSSTETADEAIEIMKDFPVCSISFDNGSEFAEFRRIEEELETEIYFAEPHKPWQRGTNENTNDILRFFFPKGYDFRNLSREYLEHVLSLINNRPRKCLGWLSPAEVFFED